MNIESFLSSIQWKEFQKSVGREIFELAQDVSIIKMELPFGKNYLYSSTPRATEYLEEISGIGRQQGSVFFKYEPLIIKHKTWNMEQLKSQGLREAVKDLQPQKTVVLDLKKTHDELLRGMRQKTRYNIRLSQKKFLKLEKSNDVNIFWDLLQETSERSEFSTHPKSYYEKLIELDGVDLYFAKRHDDFVAAAIVISHNNKMMYLHGASSYGLRKYMAPYFLHWELIKKAKAGGLDTYDFWGIDEKKWPGVTRFKRGFGGREVEYIGSYDFVFKPFWYCIYKVKNKYL